MPQPDSQSGEPGSRQSNHQDAIEFSRSKTSTQLMKRPDLSMERHIDMERRMVIICTSRRDGRLAMEYCFLDLPSEESIQSCTKWYNSESTNEKLDWHSDGIYVVQESIQHGCIASPRRQSKRLGWKVESTNHVRYTCGENIDYPAAHDTNPSLSRTRMKLRSLYDLGVFSEVYNLPAEPLEAANRFEAAEFLEAAELFDRIVEYCEDNQESLSTLSSLWNNLDAAYRLENDPIEFLQECMPLFRHPWDIDKDISALSSFQVDPCASLQPRNYPMELLKALVTPVRRSKEDISTLGHPWTGSVVFPWLGSEDLKHKMTRSDFEISLSIFKTKKAGLMDKLSAIGEILRHEIVRLASIDQGKHRRPRSSDFFAHNKGTFARVDDAVANYDQERDISRDMDLMIPSNTTIDRSLGNATASAILEEISSLTTSDEVSSEEDNEDGDFIEAEKEAVLDRLMLRVYDMFSSTGYTTCGENQSTASSSTNRSGTVEVKNCRQSTNHSATRRRGKDENEDEHDDRPGKRRNLQARSKDPEQKPQTMLACPYFKHEPHKRHPSGACCGPGWDSVHRIKAHLYRVHAQPIHCRRCYAIFDNDNQLTEHSRSTDSCAVRDSILMEGFDKDQERALKGRRTMFQAESEEEKWRIVYIILFPNTPLGDIPSPYYHACTEDRPKHLNDGSPKPPELQQFDAFLRRELPRTIRKKLQVFLEDSFGLIEETIKNDLESIVRDAQEALTRGYMDAVQRKTSPELAPGSSCKDNIEPQTGRSQASSSATENHVQQDMDILAPYAVPPDAAITEQPDTSLLATSNVAFATSSDSAYESLPNLLFDEEWLKTISDDITWSLPLEQPCRQDDVIDESFAGTLSDEILQDMFPAKSTGKGKGRANDDTSGTDFDFTNFQKQIV